MQKIEGNNSWWHHGDMPVGTLHSLEKQQVPTACSILWFGFGRGNVGDPPFISVSILLSVHAHLSLLNLPPSFIQRVVEISPKEDFGVYLKEVAPHTY